MGKKTLIKKTTSLLYQFLYNYQCFYKNKKRGASTPLLILFYRAFIFFIFLVHMQSLADPYMQ